jgi:hypothetical protein
MNLSQQIDRFLEIASEADRRSRELTRTHEEAEQAIDVCAYMLADVVRVLRDDAGMKGLQLGRKEG